MLYLFWNVTKSLVNANKEFNGTRQPVSCHNAQEMKIVSLYSKSMNYNFWIPLALFLQHGFLMKIVVAKILQKFSLFQGAVSMDGKQRKHPVHHTNYPAIVAK